MTAGGAQTHRASSRGRFAKSAKKPSKSQRRSRLMFSPRSQSRKSHRDHELRSQGSQPDSPIKETPGQIERPCLPAPSDSIVQMQKLHQEKGQHGEQVRAFPGNPESPEAAYDSGSRMQIVDFTTPLETREARTSLPSQNEPPQPMSFLDSEPTIIAESPTNFAEEAKFSRRAAPKTLPGASISLIAAERPSELRPYPQDSSQSLIRLRPVEQLKSDFRAALGLKPDCRDLLLGIKSALGDPSRDGFWREYASDVLEYLQGEIEHAYLQETTKRQLHLVGKILKLHRPFVSIKMKGVLLDRIFNLLRDAEIARVPSASYSEILTFIRGDNLGWRFFIDSINKLDQAGEADDLFFAKAFSIAQGHFREMQTIDLSLVMLFLEQLFLPHFENSSTVIRKQVVMNLAELKLAMDVRLQTQS